MVVLLHQNIYFSHGCYFLPSPSSAFSSYAFFSSAFSSSFFSLHFSNFHSFYFKFLLLSRNHSLAIQSLLASDSTMPSSFSLAPSEIVGRNSLALPFLDIRGSFKRNRCHSDVPPLSVADYISYCECISFNVLHRRYRWNFFSFLF